VLSLVLARLKPGSPSDESNGSDGETVKIDEQVEPLVRTVLEAAVRRDRAQLETALRAFTTDDAVRKGVELTLAVAGFVLIDAHGGKPDDHQIRVDAEKIAKMEEWAVPTADEIHTLLSRLLSGQSLTHQLPAESVIVLAYVVTASLLASLALKEENWWNYLDRAEAAIERG
jgi:hypothetical protein